ncbi:MAG: 1-(5-phosphoribosyl)-5-[(5-phosphoribosylamino)methylideneamino]imidazole-4-carboxamide isomerase [Bacteroidales bacterium]|nr:1-(5-phosphoribosyl)-5-[(5-phosphoribosylamino)methylideneamino]imidazole-4-carboxamide isomerase [Candidatus Physcousia equi]
MIEIIPAIDIIGGQCVRLTKGDYNTQKVYDSDPVAVAKRFEQMGVKRLHVVDLDGARSKHIVNIDVLKRITTETELIVDFGGGIKSDDDIEKALEAGAAMVTVGSIAVTDPQRTMRWIEQYGADRFVLGADARDGRISINGWKEDTGEELISFIQRYYEKGIKRVLCTDISRDGMLQGPAIELYKNIMQTFPDLQLIASGGVSGNEDIIELDKAGIPAVVFGKAFYEGRIRLEELIVC